MSFRSVVKKAIPTGVFDQIEPTGHLLEAVLANIRYGFPSRSMRIIGVTGTNGKTTTSFMIHKMLSKAGFKVALLTTVAYGVNDDIHPQIAHMTTVSAPLLQKRLAEFKSRGVEWVILETTSHALAQHRVWGIPYEIAVMTNITHEHLDYHKTFARYVAAKRRLFQIAAHHGMRLGIVNADDAQAGTFLSATPNSLAYGIKTGELTANDISLTAEGSRYKAEIGGDTYDIHCRIPGEFNVYNSLATVGVGRKLGLSKQQIEEGIESLEGVEGRMTVIDKGQPFTVIVDFAHTPDSFERLLRDVRKSTKGKLVTLFGSAGRRDEAKRAIQGKIAAKYSDELVLTEEDDRDIDGMDILEQIASGAKEGGKVKDKDMFFVHDRREAIAFALSRVKNASDTVILLGKGHEKSIERADGLHPWNEAEEVEKALVKA
jgi:UDP-N-acetylmuramoyl-L-alanyl-D-glutamate--2,6-diaminopimelate ligase